MEQQHGMMPNGQPQQHMTSMQRPQPGNVLQQIHAKIIDDLRSNLASFNGGWQSTFDIRERANRIMQLVTQLRFIGQDANKCLQIAQTYEQRTITMVPNKERYFEKMAEKLAEIRDHRAQVAKGRGAGGGMGMPGNPAMMQNSMMGVQNNGMVNMANMTAMGFPNGGMGMPGSQMNANMSQNTMFPTQLQRQMQPSPIPQLQQNSLMDPPQLQMTQQPQQMPQQPNMTNLGQTQAPGMAQTGSQAQNGQPGQPSHAEIMALATKMYNAMPDDAKNSLRERAISGMNDAQRAHLTNNKTDPLIKLFYSRATAHLRSSRAAQLPGGQQSKPGMPVGMNPGMHGGAGMQQRPPSQAKGPNIDLTGILDRQANGIKMQDSGEQVVPASNNNNSNNNMGTSNNGNNNGNGNANNNNNNNNNLMGLNGQMGAGQTPNPQMLGNQGVHNNGTQPMSAQMQQFLQLQRQARENELNAKSLMNQRQQPQPLRGQPGGLHAANGFNAAQMNSPAMPNLNRPLAPPGNQTPNTPQQNRQQQGMPSTPVNTAGQIAQHHQPMVNQNGLQPHQAQQQHQQPPNAPQSQMNQGQQGMISRAEAVAILETLPPNYREKLMSMPPPQLQMMLSRLKNKPSVAQGVPMLGMGGMQPANQQGLPNVQQAMGNTAFNGMPNQNQALPQRDQAMQVQQHSLLMQQQHQQQQVQNRQVMRMRAMDSCLFPKHLLNTLSLAIPPQLQRWGELKRHVQQNQAVVPPNTMHAILQAQLVYFQNNPMELQGAFAALQSQLRSQGQAPNGAAPGMNNLSGAPPAQMVAPAANMQAPTQNLQNPFPNQNPMAAQQRVSQMMAVTPQEIRQFRERIPNAQSLNDEQVRAAIIRTKMNQAAKAQHDMQLQKQGLQAAVPQKPPVQGVQGRPSNAPNANQPQRPPQAPAPQPPPSGPANVTKAPTQAKNSVADSTNQQRPSVPQQVPASQNGAPAQQPRAFQMPTPQQLERYTPAERAEIMAKAKQYQLHQQQQQDALRRVQSALPNQTPNQTQVAGQPPRPPGAMAKVPIKPQDRERLANMHAAVIKENQKGPPVETDAKTFALVKAMLARLWKPLQRIDNTFAGALNLLEEQRIKDIMRAKYIVQQNAKDETGEIKDYLAVTVHQLKELEGCIANYMRDLKTSKDDQDALMSRQAQNGGQAAAKPPTPTPKAQPTTPMNRAASQQGPVRKASASSKAPPAPTENKTFDWEKPTSGHGVPHYDPRNDFTPDKLKMPPTKKRKPNQPDSAASTPVAQASTPGAIGASPGMTSGKIPSPEMAKKSQQQQRIKVEAEQREAELRKFRCKEATCEAAFRGFETEELLRQHEQAEHQPIVDPLGFLIDSAAQALGVDAEGNVKEVDGVAGRAPSSTQKSATAAGQEIKSEAQQDADGKDAGISEVREMTLGGAMAKRLGIEAPTHTQEPTAADEVIDLTADPLTDVLQQEWTSGDGTDDGGSWVTWESMTKMFDAGWELTDDDPVNRNVYELRPQKTATSSPELTPPGEASSSSSSHAGSDVSQSDQLKLTVWMENETEDIWGDGTAAGVPERLVGLYLNEKARESSNDVVMADAGMDKDGRAKEPKGAAGDDDMMNWTTEVGWDSLFGPDAEPGYDYDWHKDGS